MEQCKRIEMPLHIKGVTIETALIELNRVKAKLEADGINIKYATIDVERVFSADDCPCIILEYYRECTKEEIAENKKIADAQKAYRKSVYETLKKEFEH